ncbi:MAG: AAA family ATPase [Bdellovibrionales bacterium]
MSYVAFSCCNATLWAHGKPTQFFHDLEKDLSCISDLRLLVIDNVALVYEGNENDRNEVTRFLHALNGLALRLGIGIILSTHTSKTYGASNQVASGSTAWQNAARSVVELKPETDNDPAKLILKKANHAKPQQTIELSWVNGVLEKANDHAGSESKKREIDQELFNLIEEAWEQDRPWSLASQAKARYLPKVLMDKFGLRQKAALNAIQKWISTGHLVEDQRNSRTKRGLKIKKHPFKNQEVSCV